MDRIWNCIKRLIFTIYLTITRTFMSFRQVNRCHIGTKVIGPNGKIGYCSTGGMSINPTIGEKEVSMHWRIRELEADSEGKRKVIYVWIKESELKKVFSRQNIAIGLFSWWQWYKTSWLESDVTRLMHGEPLASVEILGKKAAHGKN